MQDPAEETAETNALLGSNLKLYPLRCIRVELNGLKATEEAGGAKGTPSGHSV